VFQRFLIGILAPEMTTVSNPNIKPASEATIDHLKYFDLSIVVTNETINLFRKAADAFRICNYVV
jgi:hypothetical protein